MAKFTVIVENTKVADGLLYVRADIFDETGVNAASVGHKLVPDTKEEVVNHLTAVKNKLVELEATECVISTPSAYRVFNPISRAYSKLPDADEDYRAVLDAFEAAGCPIVTMYKMHV